MDYQIFIIKKEYLEQYKKFFPNFSKGAKICGLNITEAEIEERDGIKIGKKKTIFLFLKEYVDEILKGNNESEGYMIDILKQSQYWEGKELPFPEKVSCWNIVDDSSELIENVKKVDNIFTTVFFPECVIKEGLGKRETDNKWLLFQFAYK